jgi:NAD(P)-dependent dehydrogenase (short-subunit alcohol dehydrogenase family)
MKESTEKKICLVTGATSGIGKAAAQGLAARGFTTVIVGRDQRKSERASRFIRKRTGSPEVFYLIADLSSQKAIRRLTEEFKRKYDRLDILVNNAGAKILQRLTTADGYEMTFALNHLAYFLLTQQLLDRLQAANDARIVNVSSSAHGGALLDFEDLQNKRNYVGKKAYSQSKLANLLFTYELARRLEGTGVTVNAMAPGGVVTNFCRNNGWVSWAKHVTAHILARNLIGPTKAAETILYLATSPEVAGVTGKYFFENKPIESSPASYDTESARRLWEISERMTS